MRNVFYDVCFEPKETIRVEAGRQLYEKEADDVVPECKRRIAWETGWQVEQVVWEEMRKKGQWTISPFLSEIDEI